MQGLDGRINVADVGKAAEAAPSAASSERLGWPVAALIIIGLSGALWIMIALLVGIAL